MLDLVKTIPVHIPLPHRHARSDAPCRFTRQTVSVIVKILSSKNISCKNIALLLGVVGMQGTGEALSPGELPSVCRQAWWKSVALWLAVLLFVITAALFFPAAKGSFLVYDDTTFVTRNPHVNTGFTLDNVKHAFFGMDDVNWQPLTTLSHMLDCQIFGLKPWGPHLINVLIHAFNTAGLFLLLRKLTGATWRSFIVAALFGWHPLRVESVAWIAERKDVLCTLFWLLATWAYACYVEKEKTPAATKYYRWCIFLFALGLMAKPMMVTFPFFLLLLDYWPLKRIPADAWRIADIKPLLVEKIPLLILTAADCAATFFLQKQYGALETALPFAVRAENAVVSYARYLGKFAWPHNLAVLYPFNGHWPVAQLILAAALMLAIFLVALMLRRRAPWVTIGFLWFLGTLVPVIGLVQVGEQSLADRYTYIPMIGITIALVWGAYELTRQWRGIWWTAPLLALFGCYATLTWKQLGYWQDSHALFEHTVQVTRDNYVANAILADIYHAHGDTEQAMDHLKEALRIKPDFPPAIELQKVWQSEQQFEQDISSGRQLLHQQMLDDAQSAFEEAKRLRPDNPEAHYSLGIIHQTKHQLDDAETEFRLALLFKPDSYQARRHLAYALASEGKMNEAMHEFQTAVQQHPDSFDAHADMAQMFASKGDRKEAITELKTALQLRPGDPDITSHLAEMEAASQ